MLAVQIVGPTLAQSCSLNANVICQRYHRWANVGPTQACYLRNQVDTTY